MIAPVHIKLAMAAFNMSHGDLAKEMNVSKPTIFRYMHGDTGVSIGLVTQMERFFKERGVVFLDDGDQSATGGLGIRLAVAPDA